MKYIKEEISELDSKKIKVDLSKATRLLEIASINVKYLIGENWAIDRKENSYLCKAQVVSRESATSTVYFFFRDNTSYELLLTGVFGTFTVQVNAEVPSLKWQDMDLKNSFISALLELGLPFQGAADVFAEELGIKFDNATTIFEFSQKKVGV